MEQREFFHVPLKRYFVKEGNPYDTVEWVKRDARLYSGDNKIVFEQKDIEAPKEWSQIALNIASSKYFHIDKKTKVRENSIKQMIERVVMTIANFGKSQGYLNEEEYDIFINELRYILLHQIAAFNSPVWFNVGVEEHPQCSACFINSVEDSMKSILELNYTEGMLFKGGSGTGTNLSNLRSSKEKLSSGGVASGPVSFMKGFDAFAGVIKSGGKTRRAAKMVILNIAHPDIVDFINAKVIEEEKVKVMIEAGYENTMDTSNPKSAYYSVFFQNSNNSVRVTDEFMDRVLDDGIWETKYVTTGEVCDKYKARDLFRMMAESAWKCGDPGVQFDTTINKWHTCKASGRINASNPCSEYMFLDNTACNLSSLNLLKFLKNGSFDIEMFKHVVDIMITAMEIIVDMSSYPTDLITKNSHKFRSLGIGYANLGALLMSMGLPYDSDEGRAMASAISAVLSAEGYLTSIYWAKKMGPFEEYPKNRESFLDVMVMHYSAAKTLKATKENAQKLAKEAVELWNNVVQQGKIFGFRNAQISAIAPTGTIGLLMDCDTTGIEPDLSLIKYKWMVDGSVIKFVTKCVSDALSSLNYKPNEIDEILKFIQDKGTIEGAPYIKESDLPIFDCALKPQNGKRVLSAMAHVKMMEAVQPFISGAISKTVNMQEESTVDDVEKIYLEAWKRGLKSIAIYRDNSKNIQPLRNKESKSEARKLTTRLRLPDERNAITHKFRVGEQEGYITVGLYPDGKPGEIFLVVSKEGSTLSGLVDSFATLFSISLQYGVPLKDICTKLLNTRYEPAGATSYKQIPFATSITDYIARWLAYKFLTPQELEELGLKKPSEQDIKNEKKNETQIKKIDYFMNNKEEKATIESSTTCPVCGTVMIKSGTCYTCPQCGATTGCA